MIPITWASRSNMAGEMVTLFLAMQADYARNSNLSGALEFVNYQFGAPSCKPAATAAIISVSNSNMIGDAMRFVLWTHVAGRKARRSGSAIAAVASASRLLAISVAPNPR
jgi:hypothetical protein